MLLSKCARDCTLPGFALLERQGARGSVLTQEAKMLLQAFRETEKVLKEAGEEALSSVLF